MAVYAADIRAARKREADRVAELRQVASEGRLTVMHDPWTPETR